MQGNGKENEMVKLQMGWNGIDQERFAFFALYIYIYIFSKSDFERKKGINMIITLGREK